MRPLTTALLTILLLAAVVARAEVIQLGAPLAADLDLTPIEEIVADPDAWEGKEIRIAGEVSGVCAKQGCWMDLVSSGDAKLRVKVDDGVIVFPPDAVGRQATAEGRVEILEMDREAYGRWMRHVAEEEGVEFEPESIGPGPYRVVRLRGRGAEVAGS